MNCGQFTDLSHLEIEHNSYAQYKDGAMGLHEKGEGYSLEWAVDHM
jgi:hypothetical protein